MKAARVKSRAKKLTHGMYNKQDAAILTQQFWTSFGRYMAPVPSAEGLKINWINYKTGVKDLHFKMAANNSTSTISILLTHADSNQRIIFSTGLRSCGLCCRLR